MYDKCKEAESPTVSLKNETTRQRWELFHRAIAYAKESNDAELIDADASANNSSSATPVLSVVR